MPSRRVHRSSSGARESTTLSRGNSCRTSFLCAWNAVYFCSTLSWYVSTTYDVTAPYALRQSVNLQNMKLATRATYALASGPEQFIIRIEGEAVRPGRLRDRLAFVPLPRGHAGLGGLDG